MAYTITAYNYSHSDYNEPYLKRSMENREAAVKVAETEFKRLSSVGYGRVQVAVVNPVTGYHDNTPIWKREKNFPVNY